MKQRKKWDDLYEQACQSVEAWRKQHKKATLTAIEEKIDEELSRLRAQMMEDMALSSELADLTQVAKGERPVCPQCGSPLVANGRQRRQLTTDHEQQVELRRSKGYCQQCGLSYFPPG